MGIRVIIADDYPMIRRALCGLLESHTDIEIVGEAKDGKDAIERCLELLPDIAIVDVHMPGLNGIEATRQIVRQSPSIKVIAASSVPDQHYVMGMLTAGASGYVLKDFVSEELLDAVRTTFKGGTFLSAKIKRDVIVTLCEGTESLTKREEAVFRGLAEGRCMDEVAQDLHLEPNIANEIRRIIEHKIARSDVRDLAMYIISG
ncbi:MAG: response regulator [Planctomycetota bacterium]|jgi:DNA-binding NarL/FixJ family response regulator